MGATLVKNLCAPCNLSSFNGATLTIVTTILSKERSPVTIFNAHKKTVRCTKVMVAARPLLSQSNSNDYTVNGPALGQ